MQRQDLNGENIFIDGEIGKEFEQELVNHGANVDYYPFEEVTALIYCDYPSSAQNKGLSVCIPVDITIETNARNLFVEKRK